MNEMIGKPIDKLTLKFSLIKENYFVKAMIEKKPFFSNSLCDFAVGTMPKKIIPMIQKAVNHKSAIVFPLIYNGLSIGGIMFSKNYWDDFSYEYDLLLAYSDAVAIAIGRLIIDTNI